MAPKAAEPDELDPVAVSLIEGIRHFYGPAAQWKTLQALRLLIPKAEQEVIEEAIHEAGGGQGAIKAAAEALDVDPQTLYKRRFNTGETRAK